jgi:DNA-binding transcriptional ArsR family regulator
MMNMRSLVRAVPPGGDAGGESEDAADMHLDAVFAALSDPIRRRILQQLDGQGLLVSELAAPFNISLQGVSRHIQVLVRAGLVQQERSGRISRCTLEAAPLLEAAVWLNRYAKYWQGQFDLLAATLAEIDERRPAEAPHAPSPQTSSPQAPAPKRNRPTSRKKGN